MERGLAFGTQIFQPDFRKKSKIGSMRILVVEDEHRVAASIKKGLEQEKYAVDVVYDGVSGFDLASTEDYDLIILDLMLPGMDGLTICKQLRQKQIHTPILILTARSLTENKVEGLDGGADDYLTKPFSFEELLARIRALIRRPKDVKGDVVTVGDLKMDLGEFLVEKDGRQIQLSGKEYALLEFFMRNAGKVLTRDSIIAHVWNYDADILPNTIEVYVKKLRSKIDPHSLKNQSLIQTVRGFGYRLESFSPRPS